MKCFYKEVEKQLDSKIKVVKFDCGGKFYGKYDESGQYKGLLTNNLRECGIIA